MNHREYLLVWLEVWIVTHPPPQLTHVSKANMRKCLRKFTRPQQSQSGVKARCGKHSYWLSSVLKSRLEHRRCSLNTWSEFCGRLLWTGSRFAPLCDWWLSLCACADWNSDHSEGIAPWQHICLIYLAHLPWPVSVTVMCEWGRVLPMSGWLSISAACLVSLLFTFFVLCCSDFILNSKSFKPENSCYLFMSLCTAEVVICSIILDWI